MTATTTVRVTDRHIAEGKRGDACRCALALAVIDALDNEGESVYQVNVRPDGVDDFYFRVVVEPTEGATRQSTHLGDDIEQWIAAFDAGREVCPFDVTLTWEGE